MYSRQWEKLCIAGGVEIKKLQAEHLDAEPIIKSSMGLLRKTETIGSEKKGSGAPQVPVLCVCISLPARPPPHSQESALYDILPLCCLSSHAKQMKYREEKRRRARGRALGFPPPAS